MTTITPATTDPADTRPQPTAARDTPGDAPAYDDGEGDIDQDTAARNALRRWAASE